MRRSTSPSPKPALVLLVAALLAASSIAVRAAAPRDAPGNPFFLRTWQRTDLPVSDGSVARTWMWGPQANGGLLSEPYTEAPGGARMVQYFDKSRMEITSDPTVPAESVWYVTNGLLVVELVTGRMQIGDSSFEQRDPAVVNVAGDPDDPTGPTYATFASLLSASPIADGATITQRLDRQGFVTTDAALAARGITAAFHVKAPGIDHQVASPFWAFMNSTGIVYENDTHATAALFVNPFYATGYPISEAYWARVKVAGDYRDVLMQCFERRCLTYTPGNSPGFETEAGNVGLHYHIWRYGQPATGTLVINEIGCWPEPGQFARVELLNRTDDPVDLSEWTLSNATLSRHVALPDWTMPGGSFLDVTFDEGVDDTTFGDGATYHAGAEPLFCASPAGAAALYRTNGDSGARAAGPGAIVDFVAWSDGVSLSGGAAEDDAADAGIWSRGAYVETHPRRGVERVHVVAPGETIGRDAQATDTNTPEDWAPLGGADTYWGTPHSENSGPGPFAPAATMPHDLPQRDWTILFFLDGRDPSLLRDFISEINRMEMAGSTGDVNVVVQMAWQAGDDLTGARWYVQPDDDRRVVTSPMQEADRLDEVDPGEPDALAAFFEWAGDEFPAEHTALVLGGHGRGWKGLFTVGDRDDFLTMRELSDALSAAGGAFDTVIFDAPLMGQVEVGYQLAGLARTMVASEEISWNGIPWDSLLAGLGADPGQSAGDFADAAAEATADSWYAMGLDGYTIASIDLDGLADVLIPAFDTFTAALTTDLEDIEDADERDDNGQLLVKHAVQEAAEDYTDTNFKDLGDLARHARATPIGASDEAADVLDALEEGGDVVRWEDSGGAHPSSSGLSIYFPHDREIDDPTPKEPGAAGSRVAPPFDDPLYDPAEGDTHLYAADATMPPLGEVGGDHPIADDPAFRFPHESAWDEFLNRYYKPVADACVTFAGSCTDEVNVPIGTRLDVSGLGSSDSDGPEGPSNDVPAHTTSAVEHYYWDFDPLSDDGGPIPNYREDTLYADCDSDDCDRDGIDDTDDDRDAAGPQVEFTCVAPGSFAVRLMVWDEHHDLPRLSHEDRDNNQGRHWLHFQVDDDQVLIRCYGEAGKVSDPTEIEPGDEYTYTITLPASPTLVAPTDGFIHDRLPPEVELSSFVDCSSGECDYDTETRTVFWFGYLQAGDLVTLEFDVTLTESDTYPEEIVNCADVNDGVFDGTVCATTIVDAPPSGGTASNGHRS